MNPASKDFASILAGTSSLALTLGTDLHVSEMPKEPDECVSLIDGPGRDPDVDPVKALGKPSVQIRVRCAKDGYLAGWDLAKGISDALHGVHNETVNGMRYILIQRRGDILTLGKDENQRQQLSMNFDVMRTA